jgi:hypothetical protein
MRSHPPPLHIPARGPNRPPGFRAASRRTALVLALGAMWLVAQASVGAPPAEAIPGSAQGGTAASFTPLVLPARVGDATAVDPAAGSGPSPLPAAFTDGSAAPPLPDGRPRTRQPAARLGVVVKATPPPRIRTSHALSGNASWYCRAGVSPCTAVHPDRPGADMYAAAGPALRRAICGSDGSNCWRGRRVLVNGVAVVLADWCQCYKGQRNEKVIDLYWDAWTRVPGVERGVTVRW